MTAAAILHVTSLFGGGVDRHLRDVLRGVARRHVVWHAGAAGDVIEDPAAGRFFPLRRDALPEGADTLAAWLAASGIGLVHLHSLAEAPRTRAEWAARALRLPLVTTLHDILFLGEHAFEAPDPLEADPAWLARTSGTLRASRAVIAPSNWLARLAGELVPGLAVEVIPNGSDVEAGAAAIAPREAFLSHRPENVVALIGAIGPHKGSGLVDEIAARLEGTGVGIVLIGYLDRRLYPGWHIPGRLFVHGAFAPGDAPRLLRGYRASLALLPNTVPESFSYALSDAWAAEVPVLAAPQGAIAERIRTHGGGWLLPERCDAAHIATELAALAGGAREAERARVQSRLANPGSARLPTVAAMTRSLDALYARYGIDPASPQAADANQLEALVARNLDGGLFRPELVRLCDEMAQTYAALDDAKARAGAFESEARGWIAKLEADVRELQRQLGEATREAGELRAEADRLRLHREALERLPSPLRRLLLKLAFDARG